MKMYYFKGDPPNFGDELNHWLWPRLLPNFFDEQEDQIFLGIGSVLFDFHAASARKIVFGAGFAGYTEPPKMDGNWDVYFVRGPLTAQALGLDKKLGVGDSAILLRSCVAESSAKRYKVSFMPHWESIIDGHWEAVCAEAGIHLISPCAPVDAVIDELMASELVITEAMHGAIVSDALRVPWVPARPIQPQHRHKWFDWAGALQIDLQPLALSPSNGIEWLMNSLATTKKRAERVRRNGQSAKSLASSYFCKAGVKSLRSLANARPILSTDAAIERAHHSMLEKLHVLNQRAGRMSYVHIANADRASLTSGAPVLARSP